MTRSFSINGRAINAQSDPYVIAELSGNHNGSIERAFDIIVAAKNAGADAIKLQTYTADTLTIDHDGPGFVVDLPLWKNRTLYDLYTEASTPWEWHEALFAKGAEVGITIFSSPFDRSSLDLLENLNCPAYKIASPELVDIPLIEEVAATGKPMIMSTGMGSLEEIGEAVDAARHAGCKALALLHCVSAYPAPPEDACLRNIQELSLRFDAQSGLSDHTLGSAVAIASSALGATILEKHFTLLRSDGGVDSAFSIEPQELQELVKDMRAASKASQSPSAFGPKKSEQQNLVNRRSLYVVKDIAKGEVFTSENVRSIRPGHGLKPKHYKSILGDRAATNIPRGEPLSWDMVEGA